jgi:putative FmdB family regulatory protein
VIYPYRCGQCACEFEVVKPLAEIDRLERCTGCGSEETARYIARTHFYGASDWDRAEFNPGLGCVVRNRFHRAELARRQGLVEVGNEPVENLHKMAEAERSRRHEESWARV